MRKIKACIPRGDKELVIYGKNFIAYVRDNGHRWHLEGFTSGGGNPDPGNERGALPNSSFMMMVAAFVDFDIKLGISSNPITRTTVTVSEKNAARKLAESYLRKFLNASILSNEHLTEGDVSAMDMLEYEAKRAASNAPAEIPVIELRVANGHRVILKVHDEEGHARIIPGYKGLMIAYGPLDVAPVHHKDLPESTIVSTPVTTIEFDAADSGRTAYVMACWVNGSSKKGSWCNPQSAIIS